MSNKELIEKARNLLASHYTLLHADLMLPKLIDALESAEAKLAKAREALSTYAQYSCNGEMAFVSGFLAAKALTELDKP